MSIEKFKWDHLPGPVIGVDEVGRGCLAGPVYAGACIIPDTSILEREDLFSDLTDSKLLSEKRRARMSQAIHSHFQVSIASASTEEIDELNILWAAMLAMKRAVEGLQRQLGFTAATVLVDGHTRIPDLSPQFSQVTLIKGDLRATPISAASIAAKVARDQLMSELGKDYPGYGFEKHKGYGSLQHRNAIRELGPCRLHRKSFSGVKEFTL